MDDLISRQASFENYEEIKSYAKDTIYRRDAIDALYKEIIKRRLLGDDYDGMLDEFDTEEVLKKVPSAQETHEERTETHACDLISRADAIDAIANRTNCGDEKTLRAYVAEHNLDNGWSGGVLEAIDAIEDLPSAQPESKYEYHYDHTDCIWFRPEARNRCPSTCAQYRDGWNDAMNYIFRDGKGYRPYRRGQKYEG